MLDQKLKKCWIERTVYGEGNQFDTVIEGLDVDRIPLGERAETRRSLESLLSPMRHSEIAGQLKRCAVVLKAKDDDEGEYTAKLLMYVADLANCSGYGLVTALTNIRKTATFFPVIAEILAEVETVEKPYRLALKALTEPPKAALPKPTGPRHLSRLMRDMIAEGKIELKPNGDLTLTQEGRNKAVEART